MAKAVLQSVGDDTVAFNDQCYWVAEHVKKFLNGFQPGMEVDVTVKDVEGTPMVTFLKKAGFAPAQGARPSYPAPNQSNGGYPPRPTVVASPKPPAAPSGGGLGDQALFTLAATIAVAYNVDADAIREMVAVLKRPPTPPPVPAPVAPPVLPGEPSY